MSNASIVYPTSICVLYLLILYLSFPKMKLIMSGNMEYDPLGLHGIFWNMLITQMVYNNIILIAHVILGIKMMISICQSNYSMLCQPVSVNDNDSIRCCMYIYYILKIFQLGEIFMLIAASPNVLMVFHKISMMFMAWGAVKYIPGGSVIIWEMLDCFLHIAVFVLGFVLAYKREEVNRQGYNCINFLAVLSLLLIFLNCILILADDCEFPHQVAEAVIIYILVLFILKILEPHFNKQPREERFWSYYFWTPIILAPIIQVLLVELVKLLISLFQGRR